MPVQFPNFLSVPVRTPDYSGIGDAVNNYYAGRAMPKDDLIKAVQAEFARPNAEETLKSTRLSNVGQGLTNQKSQLEIKQLIYNLAQQKAFEDALRMAQRGGGTNPAMPASNAPMGNAPIASQPAPTAPFMPNMTMINSPSNMMSTINPQMGQMVAEALRQPQQPAQPQQAPLPQASPVEGSQTLASALTPTTETPQETVITKGAPHLAGIDEMWENRPEFRAALEKRGYKKSQQIKFDNKTGKTSVITTYPSGKVTVQSTASTGGQDGIPLTTKMISKHQNIISSIDNALPIIKQIQDLDEKEKNKEGEETSKYWEPYPRSSEGIFTGWGLGSIPGWQSQSSKYEALVSSVLDSLVGAYGLPATNEGIETVKKQLLIDHGETDAAYAKRLKNLVEDLKRRKSYSANEVKKSNKIQPVARMSNEPEYSSDDYEVVDGQQ